MKSNQRLHQGSLKKIALACAFALGASGVAVNGYSASTPANATATVLTPISITKTADLRFGSFSTSAAGQTVVISPAGGRTLTGALGSTGTAFGAASFTVSGTGTNTYAITLSGDVNITTGAGGPAEIMTVSAFTSNPSGTGALSAGSQTLTVGGTLTTVASQAAGAYTGTFTTTVEYN